MPLSPYFLQGSSNEQRLVQDLINEQLKIYGQDVVYLPRNVINKNTIMKEVTASVFDDAYRMEAYLLNYEGFEGNGDILSKFGVQTTDQVTFVVSKERYEDFISPFMAADSQIELATRPEEGDLIYLPLDNTMFEIKYVEGKKPFYQLNNLYVYTLSCEVMDYAADELIDTSIAEVDEAAVEFGFTQRLTMVGLGASTASATVVVAENTGSLGTGRYSVSQVDLINDGTGYTIAPLVGIATAPSGGTNATAVAIMTSRTGQTGQSIDSIQLTNPGYGYTVPPVITIRSQNAFGTGGIATAIISQGSLTIPTINDPGAEYGSTPTVLIGVAPSGGTNAASVAIVNTAGGISAIRYTNAGAGYTVVPNVIIDAPATGINTGNYLFREMVRGVSTGTTAYVESWDSDDRILKINNISGSGFAIGEAVVGIGTSNNGSDAKYIVQSTSDQDEYDLYNENILVESEADAILDFTEDNPFGDF
tara:strand:- start:392 stop:1822 length:1431 start_codon:yes stop_codon:yes gene_type:complete